MLHLLMLVILLPITALYRTYFMVLFLQRLLMNFVLFLSKPIVSKTLNVTPIDKIMTMRAYQTENLFDSSCGTILACVISVGFIYIET